MLEQPPMGWLGSPVGVICPRCKRLAAGWIGYRARCGPAGWRDCIRDPVDVRSSGRPFEWVMLLAPRAPLGGTAALNGQARDE